MVCAHMEDIHYNIIINYELLNNRFNMKVKNCNIYTNKALIPFPEFRYGKRRRVVRSFVDTFTVPTFPGRAEQGF
jgi:hypothetical protein